MSAATDLVDQLKSVIIAEESSAIIAATNVQTQLAAAQAQLVSQKQTSATAIAAATDQINTLQGQLAAAQNSAGALTVGDQTSLAKAYPTGTILWVQNGVYKPFVPSAGVTYLAKTPGGVTIDAGGSPTTFTGPGGVTISGFAFKNALFRAGQKYAVLTNNGWRMVDCSATSDSGGVNATGDSVTLLRFTAAGNGQNGISGYCTNSQILYCNSTGNNTLNFDVSVEGGGGKFTKCNGVTVLNSIFSNNSGPGLWFDWLNTNMNVIGGSYSNNKVGTKTGISPGVVCEISAGPLLVIGATIAGNDNGHIGLELRESGATGGAFIIGNIFDHNQFGLRQQMDPKKNPAGPRDPGLGNIIFALNTLNGTNAYGPNNISLAALRALKVLIDLNTYVAPIGSVLGYWNGGSQTSIQQLQALGFEMFGSQRAA